MSCRDHDEAHTGFEEHVLLDHLLEEFPKKGERVVIQLLSWPPSHMTVATLNCTCLDLCLNIVVIIFRSSSVL